LLGLRNNYGNSFINGCFNRFAMNSMHGVAAIYILTRLILVLALRLQIANRRYWPTVQNRGGQGNLCSRRHSLATPHFVRNIPDARPFLKLYFPRGVRKGYDDLPTEASYLYEKPM
jgi:hypothetical protein